MRRLKHRCVKSRSVKSNNGKEHFIKETSSIAKYTKRQCMMVNLVHKCPKKQGSMRRSKKPKFPQYAVVSKRVESFKTWPEYLPLKPDVLIEAGLVYTGVGDSVRCYHCGGGLRNWEADDSPFEEHAKWYPTCPHVLLVKGQTYVDKLTRGEKPEEDGPPTNVQQHSQEDRIKSAAVQSCIQNGFSEEHVGEAIETFKRKYGHTNFRGVDLCTILFEIEQSNDNVTDSRTTAKDNKEVTIEQVLEEDGTEDTDDVEELLSENQKLKANQTCKICLDDIANVIFLPCGHMVSCPQCAPALNKCPICRNFVKGYVKAYFSTA